MGKRTLAGGGRSIRKMWANTEILEGQPGEGEEVVDIQGEIPHSWVIGENKGKKFVVEGLRRFGLRVLIYILRMIVTFTVRWKIWKRMFQNPEKRRRKRSLRKKRNLRRKRRNLKRRNLNHRQVIQVKMSG